MAQPTDLKTGEQGVEKLRELMKDIRFCMFATRTTAGEIRSRPMTLQQSESDGDLFFLVSKSSDLVQDLNQDSAVNVSFANKQDFVSVAGHAHLVEDPAKKKELWSLANQAWFPRGIDDPDLGLLRVEITHAEYWEGPGKVSYLVAMATAIATHTRPENVGEHGAIDR